MMTRLILTAMLALCPSICLAQSKGKSDDEAAIKQVLGSRPQVSVSLIGNLAVSAFVRGG
jgi:hypothetical protein